MQALLVVVVLLAGCGSGGTRTTSTTPVSGNQPTCASFYPVDVFINMNGAAAGTTVTPANLFAGTDAAAGFGGWASASPYQKFESSFVSLPATVTVNGGPTHTCGFATHSLGLDATENFNTSSLNIPLRSDFVIGGWIANFPPNQDGNGGYFDVASAGGTKGYAATIQIESGTDDPACGSYGIEIESSGTATRHSACIGNVVPGGTYFVQMHVNFSSMGSCGGSITTPCAEMNVYTTNGATFTQIGSTVSVPLGATDSISLLRLGNNENGQFPGTIYFQNWMVDYTNSKFPNLPH